jgi:hypothetical protein
MSHVAVTAGVNAAGAAAAAQAIKASGTIIRVDADEFLRIAGKAEAPLVVQATVTGIFSTKYRYLTSYKGLAFFAEASYPLALPSGAEIIQAQKIWVP